MEGLGEDWSSPPLSASPTANNRPLGHVAILPPPPFLPPRPDAAQDTDEENEQPAASQRTMPDNMADATPRPGPPLHAPIPGAGAPDVVQLMRQLMLQQHERQLQEQDAECQQREEKMRLRQEDQARQQREDLARQEQARQTQQMLAVLMRAMGAATERARVPLP